MQDIDPTLSAISPLDGRYHSQLLDVSNYFSEFALMRFRCIAELEFFHAFVTKVIHKKLSHTIIEKIIDSLDEKEVLRIKTIEKTTKHDIKAVEYYLQQKLHEHHIDLAQFLHIGLTSDDINSIAYGLALTKAKEELILPKLKLLITTLGHIANVNKSVVMLARTHGQPAVPTTMGKELIVFAVRIANIYKTLTKLTIEAKLTGAVGNYNALHVINPKFDWVQFADDFVSSLGLTPNHFTTQILPADSYILLFQQIHGMNSILIGLSQDMWRYISDGYFTQSVIDKEIGSSTLPHKVNPIDFENAEGNLGVSTALCNFFMTKLPISRLQRDLSDSTVKRNFGSAIAYSLLGISSMTAGLKKIQVNENLLKQNLLQHPETITEGIQTILRMSGDDKAYEKVKGLSRGQQIDDHMINAFIESTEINPETKKLIKSLTPLSYLGLSTRLVELGLEQLKEGGFYED